MVMSVLVWVVLSAVWTGVASTGVAGTRALAGLLLSLASGPPCPADGGQ
jgi:hypothetical protein